LHANRGVSRDDDFPARERQLSQSRRWGGYNVDYVVGALYERSWDCDWIADVHSDRGGVDDNVESSRRLLNLVDSSTIPNQDTPPTASMTARSTNEAALSSVQWTQWKRVPRAPSIVCRPTSR